MTGAHTECDFTPVLPGCIPEDVERGFMQLLENMGAMADPRIAAMDIDVQDHDAVKALTKELVLAWLGVCSEDDAVWLLTQASRQRPSAYSKVARATLLSRPMEEKGSDPKVSSSRNRVLHALANAHATTGQPLVQFSTFMYFCTETEGSMRLDVMRTGNLKHRSVVRYRTIDGTAKAGTRYREQEGTLCFEPDVHELDIHIPIIADKHWDTTTEFKVELHSPDNCLLGRYLYSTRVKVMDEDTFPSNKYRKQILYARWVGAGSQAGKEGESKDDRSYRESLEDVPKWGLLTDYFRLNFANPVVRRGTIKAIMVDQLHNCYFILSLTMRIMLVDVVFKEFHLDEGRGTPHLVVIAVLMLIPFAGLHVLDHRKLTWKITGGSRAMLQKALTRKFLNYSEDSRVEMKQAGNLVMAMTRDTHALVHDGYVKCVNQVKALGALLYIVVFQVAIQIWRGAFAWEGFAIIGIFPLLLLVFLTLRRERSVAGVTKRNNTQDALVGQVERVISNYRMIADYNRRPFFVGRLEDRCKEYNTAFVHAGMIHQNNEYAAKWLTIIFVALYTVLGGIKHLNDPAHNTLGMFLANVTIIKTIGGILGTMYMNMAEMEAIFPALLNIVMLLNLPVDLPQRMKLSRTRREETSNRRTQLKKEKLDGFPVDYLPIQVDLSKLNVSGRSLNAMGDSSDGFAPSGMMAMLQGSLVSLVGPRGQGKTTLLRILGGVILPDPGGFYMPSHLRVLHVDTEPVFFVGTMYENLTFGVPPGSEDRNMCRVEIICERLGVSEKVLKWVRQGEKASNPDAEVRPWGEFLSLTERSLCQLARALIANPEVLCIHKPTMPFSNNTSADVLRLLKEFCLKKGVVQEESTHQLRRPRTCIITSSKAFGMEITDQVFLVDLSKSPCVCEIERNMVTDVMLS